MVAPITNDTAIIGARALGERPNCGDSVEKFNDSAAVCGLLT